MEMLAKFKKPIFWAGIIGSFKLLSEALGYSIITDEQVNVIADGLSALATVIAIYMDHGTEVVKEDK